MKRRLQFSLVYLLVAVGLIAACLGWWTYDSFERSVNAVLRQGGAVSYNDRVVYVSFAPWMPSGAAESWTRRHGDGDATGDLTLVFDDLKTLADQRQFLKMEFSSEAEADSCRRYFEGLPTDKYQVRFSKRGPSWWVLAVKQIES